MEKTVEFPKLGLEFNFENSFSIFGFDIAYYGVIISAGLMLALFYCVTRFKMVGVDKDLAIDVIMFGTVGGIIGARIYYVAFEWDKYKDNIAEAFNIRGGGMAIYGGIIGGLLVGFIVARIKKIRFRPFIDVIGIGFLIGQGIGRWGNFMNVEAFGANTDSVFGMTGPDVVNYLSNNRAKLELNGIIVDPQMPVHPCFFYESLWCLAGAVILHFYLKHRRFDGEVFILYCAYYGLGRFFIEGLRTDSLMIGTIRVSQLLAAVLVTVSILLILFIRAYLRKNEQANSKAIYAKTPDGISHIAKMGQSSEGKTIQNEVNKNG